MKKLQQKLTVSFVLIICILSLTTCGSSKSEEVVVDNRFKVMIPGYLSKTTALNNDAILQYQNMFKEIYFMVIEDGKDVLYQTLADNELTDEFPPSFEGFFKLMSNSDSNTDAFLKIEDRDKVKNKKIHGLPAKTYANTRDIDGIGIYYSMAIIEGKNHYYQVIAWTTAGKKVRNEKVLNEMVYSFSEL